MSAELVVILSGLGVGPAGFGVLAVLALRERPRRLQARRGAR